MDTRQPARNMLTVVLACAASAAVAAAEPPRYELDPVHTRVVFAIDHAGFSKAIGTVSGSRGSLIFDPADWSGGRLEVVVPMARLDMGDSGWTASVFAPRFLDVERHPQARFVSAALERTGGDSGRACGQLTLRGVTRPLCLDIILNKVGRYPLPPFRRTLGFSATATIKRSEYGMASWRSLVGDDVELRIEAELFRRGSKDNPTPQVDPAAEPGPASPN